MGILQGELTEILAAAASGREGGGARQCLLSFACEGQCGLVDVCLGVIRLIIHRVCLFCLGRAH
jgi:hypothetical protein